MPKVIAKPHTPIKSSAQPLRSGKPARIAGYAITPSMSAADVGVVILRPLVGTFFELAGGLDVEGDVERVHKMRVVARRIRSAARMLKRLLDKPQRRLVDELGTVTAPLGALRDEDVFIAFLRAVVRSVTAAHRPAIRKLLQERLARRQRLYVRALRVTRSPEFAALKDRGRDALETHGRDAHATMRAADFAAGRLGKLLEKVLHFDKPLESYRPAKLHRLRIHFKRLRYAGEFFESLYGRPLVRQVIEPAKRMQDFLGDAHDAEVFTRILRARGRSRPPMSAGAISELCKLLDGRFGQLVKDAQKDMKRWHDDERQLRRLMGTRPDA